MKYVSAILSIVALLTPGCVNLSTQGEPQVHAIGVYEGPVHRPQDPSGSKISIRVYTKGAPVVLALFNYQPVMWDISAAQGVVIKEIILSGAEYAKVSGIDEASVRVTRRSIGVAYDERTSKTLAPKLREITGFEVKSFQTLYRGFEFSVN